MNPAEFAALVSCVLFMTLGNLAACLLFIRIASQVHASGRTPNTSEWRRKSPARVKRTFALHRDLYPGSRLRVTSVSLMAAAVFSFFLMMFLLFSTAPRTRRLPSSQTTPSI